MWSRPAGQRPGDGVPGELLPRDPAQGAAGSRSPAGGGQDPGSLVFSADDFPTTVKSSGSEAAGFSFRSGSRTDGLN